jgi:hypothetical protein
MDVIKAQSILIIPKQTSEPSVILSAIALGRTLAENGKQVSYYLDESVRNSIDIFTDNENVINDSDSKNELIVKLDKIKSTVTNLDWEQKNEELTIKLISKEGEIGAPDISITHPNQNFDLRIFVQLKKEDIEGLSSSADTSIFSGTSIYLYDDTPSINIPLTVYKFIKQVKYKLSAENSETLLLALRNSTDNFTSNVSSEIFYVAADLVSITERSIKSPVKTKDKELDTKNIEIHTHKNDKETKDIKKNPQESTELVDKTKEYEQNKVKFATPEEISADYDPLLPATNIPEPMKLETKMVVPQTDANTPLPQAS